MPTSPKTFGQAKGLRPVRSLSKQERGYGGEWERISRLKRQRHPVCEDCQDRPSTAVHHITPFHGIDDPRRTDITNLIALCGDCHKARH